ncbi:uncharacterized protein FSUBG_13869 [Fusarium subglutinans]|uniref:Uncharacterized protein n=1 Tax=Gibberella subglutinans TaxID=42677 RepID=A0A8H5KM03_GIBSU|nr:uncharacterized protein FSUBG_13869 [Fusarium subglutinans]KAF5575698.1 hypothetical protein FSUBG_13869 [Fusarium subglutinans]
MRKPSVQQPWKAHVPTVSEIEGPVAVGLTDVEVVLVVVEDALEVVELLVVEVLELVAVVELARDVVLEVADVDEVDELVVEDAVDEDAAEVERDVMVADVTLDTEETPAGPPATKELNEETPEAPDDTVLDEGRLTMEDVVADDSALEEGALETLEGSVFDEVALVVEESVAKVVHVVNEVLGLMPEDDVDEVEAVEREAELVLVLAVKEALAAPLAEALRAELREPPELETLVAALLVAIELIVDVGAELEAEEEALFKPPAMLLNTPSEVVKKLVELVDILFETETEVELLTEPVLVEAPFEVALDTPIEELPLPETKDDESEVVDELDVRLLLDDAIEAELEMERAPPEEVATEEPTLLVDDKAPIEVGKELL